MSKLELLLLGQFECLLPSGEPIKLTMRKAEVLLAYLALAPGLRHPRERLINLLWSDRGDEQARNSLRQCLSTIRKALGDNAELTLQVDRSSVRLNADVVEVDALEFERLAADTEFDSLLDAAELYRGEFLEGITIRDAASQEWLDSQRGRFQRQYIEMLANLGQTQLASHDFKHAIRSAERLVEQDPLSESGWRLLMRACHENGDRSRALQAFKRCQKVFRDELDVEPEAETVALRDTIANGDKPRRLPTTPPASVAKPSAANDDEHSIAVLPFDNLSGDPEQEYFSDGITDSIILNLALFPGLQVKSRNSSFAFTEQIKSVGEICDELQVDYIVEGNIRRSQDRIRITVQLIESGSGNQIWGKRYDADLSDLFKLEEELSRNIAATVTGQIANDLQRIALTKSASDQQAYDLLLAGQYHLQKFEREHIVLAIDKFNQCLVQDPDNVHAHAFLYGCHSMDFLGRWTRDYRASFEHAETHVMKALELGPEQAMVQTLYAEYLSILGDCDEAMRHVDKALAINPNYPDAFATRAIISNMKGEFEAGLQAAERALQLDPYHYWAQWEQAGALYFLDRYEEAVETVDRFRTDPGFSRIFACLSYVKLGQAERARQTLQEYLQTCRQDMLSMPQNRDEWREYTKQVYQFADPCYNDEIFDGLLQAGLDEFLGDPAQPSAKTSHSIAVLPFDNLSGDPSQEYFSDGISESIILHLNLFPDLIVKSRNSSFAFKRHIKSLGEISEELGVDYLVEGSIRRSQDRIRITVQLVEAASGNQVWGKRYDAPLDDLFNLEEQLSRSIAATVTGQIESDLQRIALAKGASDQQAYDLLLAGKYHLVRGGRKNIAVALDKLEQCLAKDPDNLRAHAQLYQCHILNWMDRLVEDHQPSFGKAGEFARKTLALDPEQAEAQYTYGEYLLFCHKPDEAGPYLDRAIAISPNSPDYLTVKAMHLSILGDFEAALELATRARDLDPYNWWVDWNLAEAQFLCGHYQDAVDTISNSNNAPEFIRIYAVAANVKLGNLDAARQALQVYLEACRESMRAMPQTIDEWLKYTVDTAPFKDRDINRDIVDCLVQAGLEEQIPPTPALADIDELPSILVLPFTNLSGDPEQEYFSDGISESLIVSLSSFSGLTVKSRHASFAFKDSSRSLAEIAAEIGVQYIVEGSIRKFGDKVRITVQLGDAESGNQIWGKRFDSPLEEILALEEELVQTIGGTVSGRIEHAKKVTSMRKPAKDLRSYDYLMRGIFHLQKFSAADSKIAKEQFDKCLKIDPQNAEAHAQMGITHSIDIIENWTDDRQRSRDEADRHYQQALELVPENALTHAYYAEHQMFGRDFTLALFHANRSIELNPTLADGYSIKGYLLAIARETEHSLKNADMSMQIDPYSYYMGWNAGEVYRMAGQYQRAVDTFRSIPHMSPSVHAEIAGCLAALGRLTEARVEMEEFHRRARQQMTDYPQSEAAWRRYWNGTMPYQYEEDFEVFFDQLRQAGLCDHLLDQDIEMPSVAVLPFANLSEDPGQEYFSDGITSSLILGLGMFKGLRVKSQSSSFAFRNTTQSSTEIAQSLAVDFLVEGSIRKAGSKIRLAVQLVEADSDTQIWGKQYDAELVDILDLEQELSATVAATISGRIGHRLQQSAVRKPAASPKSFDYLLRGLYHMGKFTESDMKLARQQIEKCIELDPDNAEAQMQLGMIHSINFYQNWTADPQDSLKRSGEYLKTALELAPDNAQVQAYYGEYLFSVREYDRAEFHASRAIELNPAASEGYTAMADILCSTRRYEEALKFADQCFRLDPNAVGTGWVAGEVYRATGYYQKAIDTFRSIQHPPTTIHAHIAACLVALDQDGPARAEMRLFLTRAREEMPRIPKSRSDWREFWKASTAFQYEQDFEELFSQLLQAGLCDDSADGKHEMPSIAVLPFKNLSDDPEQSFFADGITADIISTLSRFKHLRTIARHSTETYRERDASIAEIASEQGVGYILEGNLRRSGNRIRVSTELIDAQTEQICWSERYDRDLDDLFAVQDEIVSEIALALKVQLDDGDMARQRSSGTGNIEAWQLVLGAIDLMDTYIRTNILEARSMARKALQLDPEYVVAHVTLAWTYWQEVYSGWSEDPEAALGESELAVQQALKLDPDHADALALAGTGYIPRHDAEKALQLTGRAVSIEPGNAENQALNGFAQVFAGNFDKARQSVQNVQRLCPVMPNWYYLIPAEIELFTGNLDEAVAIYRQGLAVEPDSPLCRFYLIHALMQKGDRDTAQSLADEIRALDSGVTGSGLVLTFSIDAEKRDRFRQDLAQFDLV